jgi:predicted short-subunit dehydrogenase-like oxidoreductase (DUF2520 family)
MKVVIIGAGRTGTVMGYLLKKSGFEIIGVKNKHLASAHKSVELIGAGEAFNDIDLKNNLKFADLIIITTPDDIIAQMAELLLQYDLKDSVCLMHMSGLHSSHILNKKHKKGINVFSLHPLQAVSSFDEGIKSLPDATFSLEGDKKGLEIAKLVADRLNLNYHLMKSESKVLYHTAAVVASNYMVTIINSSYKILQKAGIEDKDIKGGILNLVKGTLSNLQKMPPEEALTGPIERNDINTIREHRKELKKLAYEQLKLYDVLGAYTASMAGKDRLVALFEKELL